MHIPSTPAAAVHTAATAATAAPDTAAASHRFVTAILDRMLVGVTVVDARLRMLYVNTAARAELARLGCLKTEGSALEATDADDQTALKKAVAAAAGGRWSMVRVGDAAAATSLAVLPLPGFDTTAAAPVMIVLGVRDDARLLATQFFARSLDLTATETRVLCALAEGLVPKQIAHRHEVAVSTVRTQINSIRSRTGSRSIVELVRTLGHLPPIMPVLAGAF